MILRKTVKELTAEILLLKSELGEQQDMINTMKNLLPGSFYDKKA
jgi:hypothetical protein